MTFNINKPLVISNGRTSPPLRSHFLVPWRADIGTHSIKARTHGENITKQTSPLAYTERGLDPTYKYNCCLLWLFPARDKHEPKGQRRDFVSVAANGGSKTPVERTIRFMYYYRVIAARGCVSAKRYEHASRIERRPCTFEFYNALGVITSARRYFV